MNADAFARLRQSMIAEIAVHAIYASARIGKAAISRRVLEAMEAVPRHMFVPIELQAYAYANTPLPIGFDKTISQPFIVALMTDMLDLQPDDTVLEEDVRLDNQIQIGHGVRIGAHTAMAGCVAVAGSTRIGRYCLIGGGAGVVGHIEIADKVVVTAMSLVTHSIREPGEYSSGTPLMDNRTWRRNAARFRQLDRLFRGRRD